MILADLTIDGTPRKVIMQAPKNGFFYVLDRRTGEFLSGTPYVEMNWATGVDEHGRPIVNPEARYGITGKPALVTPGPLGGHNWHPMSFSPVTGLVYIPAIETAFPISSTRRPTRAGPAGSNTGLDRSSPRSRMPRRSARRCAPPARDG